MGAGLPGGGLRGVGKKIFLLKDAFYLDNSNATSFSSNGHRGGKLFNFWTFLDIFWTFWGVKWPPGGWGGWGEKILSLKVLFYRDNSNDTSFTPIGHRS